MSAPRGPIEASHWRDLGLGPYPRVLLAEARRIALDNRRIARAGGDPTLESAPKKGPTFRRVYELVTEMRRTNWHTKAAEANWRRGFEKNVFPVIGNKLVVAVTLEDIRRIVVPHWNGRNSIGYNLRQNLEAVLAYAVAEKHRPDNPAADLNPPLADGQEGGQSPAESPVPRGSRGDGCLAGAAGQRGGDVRGSVHRSHRLSPQ